MTDKKEPQTFTQLDGLSKTYAHFLLFKEDSPTLDAILDIFVPDQKPLFKNMFTVLNKKHVKAGLQQFGYINNQISLGEFSNRKHLDMTAYMNLPFSDTMDQEIHANKFLIDVIHEAVITHFPAEGAVSDTTDDIDKKIVQDARENLKNSLQGYRGTRAEYIKPLETPPEKVGDMKTKLNKNEILSNIPNVSHMEAIAELHRRAFLMVSDQDKEALIKASKIPIPSVKTTSTVVETLPTNPESTSEKYIKFLANYLKLDTTKIIYENPYYQANSKKYLVFEGAKGLEVAEQIEIDSSTAKPASTTKPADLQDINEPNFDYSQHLSINSVDEIVKTLLTAMNINTPTEYSSTLTAVKTNINPKYQVIQAIGDGNCFYHSFLHLSKTYRMCDQQTKRKLGVLFRINLAKNLKTIIDKIKENDTKQFFMNKLEAEQKNIGWPEWNETGEPTYSEPTYSEAFKLYPTNWVDFDDGMAYNYLMFAFPIIFVIKTGKNYESFEPTESTKDSNSTHTYIYLWNENNDVHFNIVTTTGDDPNPILSQPKAGGTTKKKVKTRKSRIFKKWKSRRQRMYKE